MAMEMLTLGWLVMTCAYPAGYPGFINVGATDIYDNAFRDFSRRALCPSELGLDDELALIINFTG